MSTDICVSMPFYFYITAESAISSQKDWVLIWAIDTALEQFTSVL